MSAIAKVKATVVVDQGMVASEGVTTEEANVTEVTIGGGVAIERVAVVKEMVQGTTVEKELDVVNGEAETVEVASGDRAR